MNEPPIASPFGELSSSGVKEDNSALLLLKVLLAGNVGAQSLLALHNLLLFSHSHRSQSFNANLASSTGLVLIVTTAIALFNGYKLFWWFFQVGFVLGAYDSISSFATVPLHPKRPWVLPLPVEVGFFLLRLALFLYLLAPAMRRFFFARPKPQSTNHPSN